jgi:uroporphyrinogen-III synthase
LHTIEPAPVERAPPVAYEAIAATSANAVRAAGAIAVLDALRGLPLYTVGARTAEAARAAGFENVMSADGDARSLARLLTRELGAGLRVLHFAGEDRARDLAPLLAPAAIAVDVLVLYRARAVEDLAAATAEALKRATIDAALHFSPRSAALFVELAEKQGLVNQTRSMRHLCLSSAVAVPLEAAGLQCEVALRPTEADLLALLKP